MSEPDLLGDMPSTLKRPPRRQLQAFHVGMVDPTHTVGLYLERGYALAICCKACERLAEWKPAELAARFGDRPELRIKDLAERFRCTGAGGCGSAEVAVWPHLFDGVWTGR